MSLAAAVAEMDAIAAQTARERPAMNDKWGATVISLSEVTVGDIRLPLLILFGAITCVLLIACANVVNFGLMKGGPRARNDCPRRARRRPRTIDASTRR